MFDISSNGIVKINRGDSFELPINLIIGDSVFQREVYQLQENDTLYIGIMEPNQPFESALIRKVLTWKDTDESGKLNVKFWPEDTECVLPGKYYYQIKLETIVVDSMSKVRTDVTTVVDKTLFYIQE